LSIPAAGDPLRWTCTLGAIRAPATRRTSRIHRGGRRERDHRPRHGLRSGGVDVERGLASARGELEPRRRRDRRVHPFAATVAARAEERELLFSSRDVHLARKPSRTAAVHIVSATRERPRTDAPRSEPRAARAVARARSRASRDLRIHGRRLRLARRVRIDPPRGRRRWRPVARDGWVRQRDERRLAARITASSRPRSA
jgi:hypothetical protein